MGKLDNKVAIVTGGGTGIGYKIAMTFAGEGADVVVCGRTMSTLEGVAEEIRALGRKSLAIPVDVSDREQVRKMVKQALEAFGKIDILVNNAGIGPRGLIIDMTEEDWDAVIDTNLKGLFFCTQTVARHMIEKRYGKIINISSTASLGAIEPGQSPYAASKSGVNTFTKASAREFGPYGINVNAIAPGRILTPLVYADRTQEQLEEFIEAGVSGAVLGRLGTVEDIAHLALFLASDDSDFITAEIIACNGGRTNLMG